MSPMESAPAIGWAKEVSYHLSLPLMISIHFTEASSDIFERDMTANMTIPSLLHLPIELPYRIFDYLNPLDILISVRDVCTQLDQMTDTYHPYQVGFSRIDQFIS